MFLWCRCFRPVLIQSSVPMLYLTRPRSFMGFRRSWSPRWHNVKLASEGFTFNNDMFPGGCVPSEVFVAPKKQKNAILKGGRGRKATKQGRVPQNPSGIRKPQQTSTDEEETVVSVDMGALSRMLDAKFDAQYKKNYERCYRMVCFKYFDICWQSERRYSAQWERSSRIQWERETGTCFPGPSYTHFLRRWRFWISISGTSACSSISSRCPSSLMRHLGSSWRTWAWKLC